MAATYEPIATTTLGSNQSTITFNSFGGYTDLVLVANFTITDSGQNYKVKFDSSSNYSDTRMLGTGSAANSYRSTGEDGIIIGNTYSGNNLIITQFMNYANTSTYKTVLSRGNVPSTLVAAHVGLWRSTSAITTMTLFQTAGSFVTGSTFTLYGIKAA